MGRPYRTCSTKKHLIYAQDQKSLSTWHISWQKFTSIASYQEPTTKVEPVLTSSWLGAQKIQFSSQWLKQS